MDIHEQNRIIRKANRELDAENKELKARVVELEEDNFRLDKRVRELTAQLFRMTLEFEGAKNNIVLPEPDNDSDDLPKY